MENTKTLPMGKRILCALLALVLAMGICIPVIPHSAYAEGQDDPGTEQIVEPVVTPSDEGVQASESETSSTEVSDADDPDALLDEESDSKEITLLGEDAAPPIDPVIQAIDMSPYLDASGMQIVVNNKPYTAQLNDQGKYEIKGLTLHAGDRIKFRLAFSGVPVMAGQKVFIQFDSNYFKNLKETSVPIMQGNSKVGTAYIAANGQIDFVPDPEWIAKNANEQGVATLYNNTVMVEGTLGEKIGGDDPETHNVFKIGDIEIIFPMDDTNYGTDATIEKNFVSFDSATREATYSIKVTNTSSNGAQIKNLVVTDNFDTESKAYLAQINGKKYYKNISSPGATAKIDDNSKTASWTYATLDAGVDNAKTITYKVKFTDSYFDQSPQLVNTATATWGGKSRSDTETKSFGGVLRIVKSTPDTFLYEQNGHVYIKYQIQVSAPSTNPANFDNVTVEDHFTQGGDAVKGYKTPLPANTTYNASTNRLVWNVGTMKPGETKTLNYEVEVKEDALKGGTGATVDKKMTNVADLKINDQPYSSHSKQIDLKKEWIKKSGTINSDNTVSFNLVINAKKNDLPEFEGVKFIQDTVSGNFYYDDNDYVTIQRYKNNQAYGDPVTFKFADIKEADNKFTINLPANLQGAYEYHVSYIAKPLNPSIRVVSNKAIAGVGPGGDQTQTYNHEAHAEGLTNNDFTIQKSYVSHITDAQGNDFIKWKTAINTPGIPKNSVFTDWDTSSTAGSVIFDQSVLDSIVVKDKNGNVVDSSNYTAELATIDNRSGFKMTFTQDVLGGNFTVEYVTPVNTTNVKTETTDNDVWTIYKNKSKMDIGGMTHDSEANHEFKLYKAFDKTAGDLDWTTNTLTWKIQINKGSSLSGNANLIEYIPEGLEFVKAEITDRGSDKAANTALGTPEVDVPNVIDNLKGVSQVVTIPVTGLYQAPAYYEQQKENNDGMIWVTVTTKIVDEELLTGHGHSVDKKGDNADVTATNKVSKKFINKAELVYNQSKLTDTADKTVERTILQKTSDIALDNRPDITYKVKINPEGADLQPVEGKTHIMLNDRMSDNVFLKNGSIVVTSNGVDVTGQCKNLKIADDFHGFEMEVPDNMPLEISYKATVQGIEGSAVEIYNYAYVFGDYETHSKTTVEEFVILGAQATSDTGANFSIEKSDSRSKSVVAGAKFNLFRAATVELEDGSKSFVKGDDGKPVLEKITLSNDTTGADGILHFEADDIMDINHDGVYAYQEYEAPEGYIVDDTLYYVQFREHADFTKEFGFTPTAIVNTQGINMTNEFKETTNQIEVKKTLDERDAAVTATPTSASNQQFTFTLEYVGADVEDTPYKSYDNETGAFSNPVNKGDQFTRTITGKGNAWFDTFHFGTVGEYEFKLTENELTDAQKKAGYTHDDSEYKVIVKVEDTDGHGLKSTKVITKEEANCADVTFNNGYKLNASVAVPVTKTLEGMAAETAKETEKEFTFGLFEVNADGTVDEDPMDTVTIPWTDDRSVTKNNFFKQLRFSTDSQATDIVGGVGTYNYQIKEMGEALPGFEENDQVYDVKLVVSDDGTDSGQLDMKMYLDGEIVDMIAFTPEGATDNTTVEYVVIDPFQFVFTNVYFANGKVVLEADKQLHGKRAEALKDKEFNFEVKDETGKVVATGTNDASGKIVFSEIEYKDMQFTEDKGSQTFTYTMYEVKGNDPQITYSDTQIKVEVEVKDNGDGTLTCTPTYPAVGKTFVNTYNENPKTGDEMPVLPIALIAALSGLVCLFSGIAARRRNDAQA